MPTNTMLRPGHPWRCALPLFAALTLVPQACSPAQGEAQRDAVKESATPSPAAQPKQQAAQLEAQAVPLPVPFPLTFPVPVEVPQLDQRDAYSNPATNLAYIAHFTLLARCEVTGDLGIATISNVPSIGAVLPDAKAGVGVVMVGAQPNLAWKAEALELLSQGKTAQEVATLLPDSPETMDAHGMLGVLDSEGRGAAFIGKYVTGGPNRTHSLRGANCMAVVCEVNAWREISRAMVGKFENKEGLSLPERMILALRAGWNTRVTSETHHDRHFHFHPSASAALLVVLEGGIYDGGDRLIDLRVDLSNDPLPRMVEQYHAWCAAAIVPRMPVMLRQLDTETEAYDLNRAWAARARNRTPLEEW